MSIFKKNCWENIFKEKELQERLELIDKMKVAENILILANKKGKHNVFLFTSLYLNLKV